MNIEDFEEVVYVHLGKRIPFPLSNSLANTKHHLEGTRLTLLTDRPNKFNFGELNIIDTNKLKKNEIHQKFKFISEQDSKFRDGFWNKASARLFYILDYMDTYGLSRIIHLENDCLISFSLPDMITISNYFDEDIIIPRESYKRAILPIMLVKSRESFSKCLNDFNKILQKNPKLDEMEIFARLIDTKSYINSLPAIPSVQFLDKVDKNEESLLSTNFNKIGAVFDPSIYGQYMLGQDPTNDRYIRTAGYVNPNSHISTQASSWNLKKQGEFLEIHVSINGSEYYRIHNVHAHGKYLVPLIAKNYSYYDKIITNLNNKVFGKKFATKLFLHNLRFDTDTLVEFARQWFSKFKIYFCSVLHLKL